MLKNSKGFGLLEVVIIASVLTIFIVSIVVVFQTLFSQSSSTIKNTQASFLAEEGIEALKSMRDYSWDTRIETLVPGTQYYLDFTDSWVSTTDLRYVDSFHRYFMISSVSRDSNGRIVDSGGTDDPNTKKVTVNVEWWNKNATSTRSLSTYIANIHDN